MKAALNVVQSELDSMRRLAKTTRDEAVHEESRAENDKDTRGLEASYLARGQADRVAELCLTVQRLKHLELLEFKPGQKIALSALVELQGVSGKRWCFLTPAGGGIRAKVAEIEVQLVTPWAPLGRCLIGAVLGDNIELRMGGQQREFQVIRVQ